MVFLKVKIDTRSEMILKETKDNIDKLLDINSKGIEVNEENFKKIKKMSEILYALSHSVLSVGGINLMLESDDGTSFTIL